MVSTRHHPRPFPEPTLAPSRSPNSTSSSPSKDTPPSPTESTPSTTSKRRSTSARSKTLVSSTDSTALTPSKPPALTRRSKSSRASSPYSKYVHTPPPLFLAWLLLSIPLVTWDTLYVLLRPHTMPGGRYHSPFWTPYALYGTVDYMYGWPAWEAHNGFTAAQGTLNAVEVIMYGFYLSIVARGVEGGYMDGFLKKMFKEDVEVQGRLVPEAVVICFAGAVMTLSKTILYWLNEAFSGFESIGHNSLGNLFWLWIVPNGAWIVLPTYMIYLLGGEIIAAMKKSAGGTKRDS